jgi:ATP-dependent Clp protease ATP-binding subunit ClpA
MTFGSSMRAILKQSNAEADKLGAWEVRPEHILLAVLDTAEDAVGDVLRKAGVTREAILRVL